MGQRRIYIKLIMVVETLSALDATAAAIRAYQGGELRPTPEAITVEYQIPVRFLAGYGDWETLPPDARIFDPTMVEVTSRKKYERLRAGIGSKPSIPLRQWPDIVLKNLRTFGLLGLFQLMDMHSQTPFWDPSQLWAVVIDINTMT